MVSTALPNPGVWTIRHCVSVALRSSGPVGAGRSKGFRALLVPGSMGSQTAFCITGKNDDRRGSARRNAGYLRGSAYSVTLI